MTPSERLQKLNASRNDLKRRRAKRSERHQSTAIIDHKLKQATCNELNEECGMSNALTVEQKLHEIECAVDDLSSLAHTQDGARALAASNLEGIERRLRYLRFDLQTPQAAE